jgi:hypothetical protein
MATQQEEMTVSPKASLKTLAFSLVLASSIIASVGAHAAGLSFGPTISGGSQIGWGGSVNQVMPVDTFRHPPCYADYGCGPAPAPATYPGYPHRPTLFDTNDQFDTTGNLNPGGGGGGVKPGKKPNLD